METGARSRVAIVGGGISGLAAAHRLVELSQAENCPIEITLFDAAPSPGGVFGTEQIDGYRLELGADMFITDKPWAVRLCERLGLGDQLIAPDPRYRKSLILHRGRPVETPQAFQLMVPGKVWPIVTTPLLSPLGKLRLMCEAFIASRPASDQQDESLADFVTRRLGREALERIVQPLVGGIYTGDPARLSLLATLPRFREMEQKQGSLTRGMWRSRRKNMASGTGQGASAGVSGARYGLFVSLRQGMSQLQQALVSRITPAVEIRAGTSVSRIALDAMAGTHRFQVQTSAAKECFDQVIVATPAYRAAETIQTAFPELAESLRAIEYASSVLVITGHRLEHIEHPLDAYGLVVPARENRKVLAVSIPSRKFPDSVPEGRVALRTFVGGALQPELCELNDAQLLTLVLDELRTIFGVRGTPEVQRIVRYSRAMPQYHVGHLDRVAAIEVLERATGGLHLCGNAYRGVGLPDCIHSGEQAAERAFEQLGQKVLGSAG